MVGIGQMIIIYFYGKKYHYPKGESASVKEKFTAFIDAIPVLLVPIIIIGGVTAGIFTATESGAVAIVYTLILILLVFRKKTSLNEFVEVFKNSILKIGPTLFCVTGATAYAYLMAYFKVPLLIQTFGMELGLGRIGALFFILIMCIFLGTFMSGVATIITFMPIITTLGAIGNVHPIQLGVVVCMTMALGLLTPPYGLCIMLASNIAEIEVMQAFKTTLIFIAFFLIVVSLCIFFPQIILFLPRLIMPTVV